MYVNTTQIGNKCDCWESRTQSERRYVCSIVAIRSGWKMVGGFHGVLLLSSKHTRSLVWWENTLWKAVRDTIWRTNNTTWCDGRISHYLCEGHIEITSIWPKSLARYISRFALIEGAIWKGDILVADVEELEQVDASEIHARRLHAKGELTPMKGDNFIFPVADGTVNISGGDQRLRTSTLIRGRSDRGEEQEILQGESDGLSSPKPLQDDSTRDDAEAKNDFWSVTGDFIYRHHMEPRVKLYMPTEESLPIPLKYIDVTRK